MTQHVDHAAQLAADVAYRAGVTGSFATGVAGALQWLEVNSVAVGLLASIVIGIAGLIGRLILQHRHNREIQRIAELQIDLRREELKREFPEIF